MYGPYKYKILNKNKILAPRLYTQRYDKNFIEIFVNTSLQECEKRDVKGLYKKARSGIIKDMTGISAPYEIPEAPDIEIKTETESLKKAVSRVIKYITPKLKLEQ